MNTDESIATRRSLLDRLRDLSDQESWQDFFNSYWRLVYRVALKAGMTETEAEEIVQDTVISVARHIKGFRYEPSVCSFRSWMLRITRWRIIDQLKRRSREQTMREPSRPVWDERPGEEIADPANSNLDRIWEEEWARNLYEAAAARVKDQVSLEQFQMFDLNVTEDWPAPKVAQALGVSTARVYLAKHRVSRLMKKALQQLEAGS